MRKIVILAAMLLSTPAHAEDAKKCGTVEECQKQIDNLNAQITALNRTIKILTIEAQDYLYNWGTVANQYESLKASMQADGGSKP
jgi:hypothetical protein